MADLFNAIGQSNSMQDFLSAQAGYGLKLIDIRYDRFAFKTFGSTNGEWVHRPIINDIPESGKIGWIGYTFNPPGSYTGQWLVRHTTTPTGYPANVITTSGTGTNLIINFDNTATVIVSPGFGKTVPITTSWSGSGQTAPSLNCDGWLVALIYTAGL